MNKRYLRGIAGIGLACLLSAGTQQALAQQFPAEPITFVVSVNAGGGTDGIARVFAQALTEKLTQPVVVKNVPGASGMLGSMAVVNAKKNGYTLLFEGSNVTLLPQVRKLSYKVGEDLVPVAMLLDGGSFLLVNSQLPIHSVKELIAYGKANPGKLSYGSSGVGTITHLAMVNLTRLGGFDALHVPYSGSAEYGAATAAGIVSMGFVSPEAARGLIDSGKVRAIAASGLDRIPILPDLPTVRESGLPDFNYSNWMGVFAPKGTPDDVVKKLNGLLNQAGKDEKVMAFLTEQGKIIKDGPPEMFAEVVRQDLLDKAKAAEAAGLKKAE